MMAIVAKSALEVKEQFDNDSDFGGVDITKGHRGAITNWLNKYLGGDVNRRMTLGWLTGKVGEISSHGLSPSEWYALALWIDSREDDGVWEVGATFPVEASLVLTEALRGVAKAQRGAVELEGETQMLLAATGQLGGVITAVTDEDGNSTHVDGVIVPVEQESPEPEPEPETNVRRFTF